MYGISQYRHLLVINSPVNLFIVCFSYFHWFIGRYNQIKLLVLHVEQANETGNVVKIYKR